MARGYQPLGGNGGGGEYTAGTGLSLSPENQFNITNTAVTAGEYGSTAAKTITVTVNAQGQLTDASEQDIAIAATQVSSGLVTDTEYDYLHGTTSNIQNQIDNLAAGQVSKSAVTLSMTNVNIANPGTFEFGGIPLAEGETLFLPYQDLPEENGLWTFNGVSSPLTRAPSMNTWAEVIGVQVIIPPTTPYPTGSIWRGTSASTGTIGVTPITFVLMPSGLYVSGNGIAISGDIINANIAIGNIDSQTKSANGLVTNGYQVFAQNADAINPGMVSTGTQTFAGSKTFSSPIIASITGNAATATTASTATSATNATNAVNVATTATTTNATYYLTFVASNSSSNQTMRMATAMTYNPSTGIFAVPEAIIPELTVNSTAGSNLPFQVISNSPQNNNSYYGMSIEKNDGAMLSGNQIGTINYRGERGDGVGTSVRITAWASENWSPTLIGSYLTVDVVPTGTSTRTQALRIGNIGGSNINSQFFGSVTATAFLGNATSATTATNIAGGTATQILVQTAAGATSFITAPVNGQKTYTRWNGTSYDNTTPFGWYSYQDTASSITPIAVPANTDTALSNDALGTSTTTTYAVTGISTVWNSTTNRFDFTGLAPGDMVNVRVTISVTTTAPNQNVDVRFNGAIGGSPPFTLVFASIQFKTVGTHSIAADVVVAMYNTNTTNNPASISVLSDDACDVVVNTFLVSVNRR